MQRHANHGSMKQHVFANQQKVRIMSNIRTQKGTRGDGTEFWYATAFHYITEAVKGDTEEEALRELKARLEFHHRNLSSQLRLVDLCLNDIPENIKSQE